MPAKAPADMDLRDRCDIRIGFPADDAGSSANWLREIADWLEAEGIHDEIYLEGELAARLETECASLTGKPAALWFPTGTMAQMAAALVHAGATGRTRIGLHPNSHLLLHEDGSIKKLAGLEPVHIGEWHRGIDAADLKAAGDLACLFIELPQRHNGGLCPDWDVLVATADAARGSGARLHMDGARLWSAREAFDGRSYVEICAPFDSVYMSFYKDVGALGGAVLVGDEDFIAQARQWRHRQGGLQVRGWPVMADALRRLPDSIAAMPGWIAAARELAELVRSTGLAVEPAAVRTNMFHVRLPVTKDDFSRFRNQIAERKGVWLGRSTWDIDGRPGISLEIAVNAHLASADRDRLRDAFGLLADLAVA
ncbi:threonine aldolase family protein [Hyphobacterium sp.]|uniref:threonine aldolase family protein n=1 Tax=Hyphobacterium sp. TaxID=2004662 RepID=UPI003B523477